MVDFLMYLVVLLVFSGLFTAGYYIGALVVKAATAASYEAGVDDTVVVLVDNLEKASTDPDFNPDATYIFLRNAIEKEVDSNAECSSDTGPACG
mgnify:CR=1 FL=1